MENIDEIINNLDVNKFWKDDEAAHLNNCFNEKATQAALGIRMSEECVFSELGEEGEPWGYTEPKKRLELNKRYNEKAIKTVGIPLLSENILPVEKTLPNFNGIGVIFNGKYSMYHGSEWLMPATDNENELEKILNKVEKLSDDEFKNLICPANWEQEKNRIFNEYGIKPTTWHGIRGPVTLACSLFGVENLIYLLIDNPELAKRFSNNIADTIIKYTKLKDIECDITNSNGFSFLDDDCCLLNSELYQQFAYPILEKVFNEFSPNQDDVRYQHSDSNMEHLLPLLAKFNLSGCNFGPTLSVKNIRKYMPNTRIDGQLAPFTFMNNNKEDIFNEVKRDCLMIKECKTKGLNITTAGSINNGSSLESMKLVMATIQWFGQI